MCSPQLAGVFAVYCLAHCRGNVFTFPYKMGDGNAEPFHLARRKPFLKRGPDLSSCPSSKRASSAGQTDYISLCLEHALAQKVAQRLCRFIDAGGHFIDRASLAAEIDFNGLA